MNNKEIQQVVLEKTKYIIKIILENSKKNYEIQYDEELSRVFLKVTFPAFTQKYFYIDHVGSIYDDKKHQLYNGVMEFRKTALILQSLFRKIRFESNNVLLETEASIRNRNVKVTVNYKEIKDFIIQEEIKEWVFNSTLLGLRTVAYYYFDNFDEFYIFKQDKRKLSIYYKLKKIDMIEAKNVIVISNSEESKNVQIENIEYEH